MHVSVTLIRFVCCDFVTNSKKSFIGLLEIFSWSASSLSQKSLQISYNTLTADLISRKYHSWYGNDFLLQMILHYNESRREILFSKNVPTFDNSVPHHFAPRARIVIFDTFSAVERRNPLPKFAYRVTIFRKIGLNGRKMTRLWGILLCVPQRQKICILDFINTPPYERINFIKFENGLFFRFNIIFRFRKLWIFENAGYITAVYYELDLRTFSIEICVVLIITLLAVRSQIDYF